MRLGTLFSGIGAAEQAAKRVYQDELEISFACEFDKFARKSFLANYDIDPNHFHKDINDMDGTQYCGKVDIVIGGSPCQAFSIAGLRKGLEDKRGQLIWQYYRIIKEIMPTVFIYENVRGMVSDNQGKTLKDFLEVFRDLGYSCHAEVLNTKDYGVPQNRERIYIIGFLDSAHYYRFEYAPKQQLEKRLKDVLQEWVPVKYFLSQKMIEQIDRTDHLTSDRVNNTLRSGGSSSLSKKHAFDVIIVEGNAKFGDSINLTHQKSKARRGRVGKGVAQTLDCACNQAVYDFMIRKLTPRECLRLQDFTESFKIVVSDTQAYKQAGNSMSVNVLEMIFNQIEDSRGNRKTDNLLSLQQEG